MRFSRHSTLIAAYEALSKRTSNLPCMRIVSLNIQHGGGSRADRIGDWLEITQPDFLVLSEWRSNTPGQLLADRIERLGLVHRAASLRPSKGNGVLIAARRPFIAKRITPARTPKGEMLMARFEDRLHLLGCYFPNLAAKAPFFAACLRTARFMVDGPFLMIGDLHTGHNDLDVEAPGFRFHCADQFERLTTNSGLVDLWRRIHFDRREWTWRSRLNGFRLDHAFANPAFLEQYPKLHCKYDHETRDQRISDHSAIVLDVMPR